VLNASLAPAAALRLWPMLVGGALLLLFLRRRVPAKTPEHPATESKNPLRLGSAVLMAVGFQLVVMMLNLLKTQLGDPGVYLSAALAGLTDMDALTFAMSGLAEDASQIGVAAGALVVGMIVNTLFKTGFALALGSPAYRKTAVTGLLVIAALGGLGLFLATRITVAA
jgi:uncharacterized membrane protein (DUF4010 family)